METKNAQIEKLEREIAMEESFFAAACEHPTYNDQFMAALDRHGREIFEMKQKLESLKNS